MADWVLRKIRLVLQSLRAWLYVVGVSQHALSFFVRTQRNPRVSQLIPDRVGAQVCDYVSQGHTSSGRRVHGAMASHLRGCGRHSNIDCCAKEIHRWVHAIEVGWIKSIPDPLPPLRNYQARLSFRAFLRCWGSGLLQKGISETFEQKARSPVIWRDDRPSKWALRVWDRATRL